MLPKIGYTLSMEKTRISDNLLKVAKVTVSDNVIEFPEVIVSDNLLDDYRAILGDDHNGGYTNYTVVCGLFRIACTEPQPKDR